MNSSAVLLCVIRAVSFTQDTGLTCHQPLMACVDCVVMNSRNCLANLFIKIVKIY